MRGTWSPDYTAYRIEQVDIDRGDVSVVNYGANPATGDVHGRRTPTSTSTQLDDEQALALSAALQTRHARRAASGRGAAATISRAELDAARRVRRPAPPRPCSGLNAGP
jgi:hypothetical protein